MAHRRLGIALIVVATLLAFLAIFALWANRQFLDTDNWTDTSTKLLENDQVRTQVSDYLVDQLYANVDVEGRIRAALPPRAQPLAGPAAGGLRQLANNVTNKLLQRPLPQRAWERANRHAHRQLIAVLNGGGDVVSTTNGNVVLDLKALLGQTEGRVGIGGRAGEKLPSDAAQLTILRSDQLSLAQDIVQVLKSLAIVLVVLALGLYGLAIYLARGWRREALRATGVGFIVAGAGALVARGLAGNVVGDSLATTESVRPAIDAVWSIGTSLLEEAAVASIFYGVVIVFAAWLAGPTRAAVGTRRALAPWLREPTIAYGVLAVIVLLLIAWGPTPATRRFLPMLLLIALLVAGVEVLRRQTAREHPNASREEATQRMREWASGLTRRGRGERGRADELERLGRLREQGILDDAEFEREKARILGATG
ncbi:MAG TPA: SHOCT domain-containing protein [Thermoleophilaceae bacterium]|jgi:hypothetical protein